MRDKNQNYYVMLMQWNLIYYIYIFVNIFKIFRKYFQVTAFYCINGFLILMFIIAVYLFKKSWREIYLPLLQIRYDSSLQYKINGLDLPLCAARIPINHNMLHSIRPINSDAAML
jgi:hypothetical protein